jgi:energy-coupling factor transporter ATP-binding protein EcfA2
VFDYQFCEVKEMKRIKLRFADLEVEFTDRDLALKRVEEWAEKGIVRVQVVFGPEGCGKTAWLKQSAALLRELGFEVVYIDPLRRDFIAYTDLKDFVRKLMKAASEVLGIAPLKLATLALDFGDYALKLGKRKVAILVDDAFQAIGLDKAATYVKALLNLIEYPPKEYERIVAVVTTSEGLSRGEIGRHRWAELTPMWNMPREGFKQLYNQLPGDKPGFEQVWRITGGNPKLLAELYKYEWNVDAIVTRIAGEKQIKTFMSSLSGVERELLLNAIDDPDVLMSREGVKLIPKLVELNLIVHEMYDRKPWLWIDIPPPEKDSELGIGKYVAWQTPLHREAVRRALGC